jgi:hypothetical protein
MKWDIQQQIAKEFAGVPDEQAHRTQMNQVLQDPILGPFCKNLWKPRGSSKK